MISSKVLPLARKSHKSLVNQPPSFLPLTPPSIYSSLLLSLPPSIYPPLFSCIHYPPFNLFLQSSIYPDHSLCSSPPPSVHMFIYLPFNPFLHAYVYPDHSLCSSPPPSVHMLINSLSIHPSILFILSIHPIHQSAIYPSNRSFVLSVPKSIYLADLLFVYSSIHPSLNPLILSVNHQLVRLFLPLIILLSIHLSMCPYSCLVRQSFI